MNDDFIKALNEALGLNESKRDVDTDDVAAHTFKQTGPQRLIISLEKDGLHVDMPRDSRANTVIFGEILNSFMQGEMDSADLAIRMSLMTTVIDSYVTQVAQLKQIGEAKEKAEAMKKMKSYLVQNDDQYRELMQLLAAKKFRWLPGTIKQTADSDPLPVNGDYVIIANRNTIWWRLPEWERSKGEGDPLRYEDWKELEEKRTDELSN